jgi:predicted nucleic acid-binding protein
LGEIKHTIKILSEKIKITDNLGTDIKELFKNKQIEDFEDGLQYYAAKRSKVDAIITYNKNDFYFSQIKVHNPEEYLVARFCQ